MGRESTKEPPKGYRYEQVYSPYSDEEARLVLVKVDQSKHRPGDSDEASKNPLDEKLRHGEPKSRHFQDWMPQKGTIRLGIDGQPINPEARPPVRPEEELMEKVFGPGYRKRLWKMMKGTE